VSGATSKKYLLKFKLLQKNSAEQPIWMSGFHAYKPDKLLHAVRDGVSLTYSWLMYIVEIDIQE
jgi:hypothetical protein